MSKTLCYSVRLESCYRYSPKSYKLTDYSGNSCFIPAMAFFGEDYEVTKGNAYWIAEWVLKNKDIVYSDKKKAYIDDRGNKTKDVVTWVPQHMEPVENEIDELKR